MAAVVAMDVDPASSAAYGGPLVADGEGASSAPSGGGGTVFGSGRPSVKIPIRSSQTGDVVEIFGDEFPEETEGLLTLLTGELPSLEVWIQCMLMYYRQVGPLPEAPHPQLF